jgi:peptidyl-prolyl cis-trans isomerase C
MKPMSGLRALMREPLLHFILIGAAIFMLYEMAGKPAVTADVARPVSRRIVVDQAQLRELMVNFEQNQGRVPTRAELSKQVDDWVREEVLCRAALVAGVDRNDPVIRQRLVNLMQWYLAGEGADGEPGQDALRRYYEGDSAGATNTLLFEQIFFNPALRDSVLMAARKTLDSLQAGKQTGMEAAQAQGDPLVVGGDKAAEELQQGRPEDLATNFGMPFIELVRRMPLDTWSGPVQSSLGWHLVKHRLSENPTAGEKRMERRREEHLDQTAPDLNYEDLRKHYEVEVAPFPAEVQK